MEEEKKIPIDSPCAVSAGGMLTESAVIAAYATALLLIVIIGIRGMTVYSLESFYRTMAAADLLEGLSRGRQALVGSLRIGPLPTVMLGIAAAFPAVSVSREASVVIAAVSALLLCWHVNGLWRSKGIHPLIRAAGGLSVLLLPQVAMSIQTGRSTMVFVALTVAGLVFVARWLEDRRLRSLAYAGLFFGLGLTVRFQVVFVALGAALLITAVLVRKPRKGQLEGSGFIFLTPVAYMILLWLGGNWLILGNPLFPLRGVVRSLRLEQTTLPELLVSGCEWGVLVLVTIIAVGVFVPRFLSRKADTPPVRSFVLAAGIAIAGITAFFYPMRVEMEGPDAKVSYVIDRLQATYHNTSFIVTGYAGYEFSLEAGEDEEDAWIHVMHLEQSKLDKIMEDFRGRNVFLIVDMQDLAEGWLDVGLEWVEPWTNIPEQFFYVDRVGSRLVFEVFSPETPEPPAATSPL